MNNSQALKNLKQSAKQQTEELKSFSHEIHQENWNKLSKDLTAITSKKLNTIEKNINSTMEDIAEQNKSRYSLKVMIWTSVSIMIIGLLIGIILAEYTPKYQERTMWLVPKKMRYTHKDGTKYIMTNKPEYNNDKTITFIKIGE